MKKIVIIGNGIAGVTAARHIRKLSENEITIISSETEHFFSRTALMYIFMGHMKYEHTKPYEDWFWEKNRINLKKAHVRKVDPTKKLLELDSGENILFDSLIIATGSKPNKFGWPGQDLEGVQGLYSKQDLDLLEKNSATSKSAVIVGGGLIGIELAEMLLTRDIKVTFLVREASFWNGVLPDGESQMINRHILEHHIDLRLNTNLVEILADENGRARSVITDGGEEIPCQIIGLTAGVTPNIDFLKDSGIETRKGVMVNRFLETNVKDIYAIGDCAQQREGIGQRRPIEAVWYTGRMMGETVAQTICGNPMQYNPGPWFNSAKFLDIEYQTYGWVWAKPKENEARFYWEHDTKNICIHVVYDKTSREFIGINNFGIRMRHDFFDKVLRDSKSTEYVMAHLADANFDPEFYKKYEKNILLKFNQENNTNITLKAKSWKRIFNLKSK